MNARFSKMLGSLAAVGAGMALHAVVTNALADTANGPIKMFASNMKWEPMAEGSPLKIVKLWGEFGKDGGYGMLVKLPAGFSTGMHSHSSDYYSVELQGKKIHRGKEEEKSEAYTPGSFTKEVPGHVHEDVCLGPEDCILLITQGQKFDFIPDKK